MSWNPLKFCSSFWARKPACSKLRRRTASRPRRVELLVERLEERRLLSADFGFALGIGSTNLDQGRAVATDDAGNVYVTGGFTGTADFDPGPGTVTLTSSAGFADVFVAKYSAAGTLTWARNMGGASSDIAYGIAVDDTGNVYTTGFFAATGDFDPGPGTFLLANPGYADIFVSKLDAAGNFVWAKSISGWSHKEVHGLAVDTAGNALITGAFYGTVDFDPGPGTFELTSSGGNIDVFVAKLDSGGSFAWAKRMGGTSSDVAQGITVNQAGNVYTTGYFAGTADFDPGPGTFDLTSAGFEDIFVSKLDANGNFVWARRMGGTSALGFSDHSYGITVDGAGAVYTTGYFAGTADFDPGIGTFNLISAGALDIFVSKLDANGNFVWARPMGGTAVEIAYGIAVDTAGNVSTTGHCWGTGDFDPGTAVFNLTSAGVTDAFISTLDAAGNFVWAKRMGGASEDTGYGIAVDGTGNVYTTGSFRGAVDFDPGAGTYVLTSAGGSSDAFVSQLRQYAPPKAKAGGPYTVAEGGNVTLDASGTSDPDQSNTSLIYLWDLDSDGIFGETGVNAAQGSETGMTPTFSAAGLDGPSSGTVGLRVTDSSGLTSTTSATIQITNVAPAAAINGAPTNSPEGTTISLTSTVSDPGGRYDVASHSWTVTKNGTWYAAGSAADFHFTPDDDGTYVVSLAADDGDGGTGTDSKTIHVTNVAPMITSFTSSSGMAEGQVVTFTAAFTDAGSGDTHTALFAWGDGTTSVAEVTEAAGSGSASGNHVYAQGGIYTITLSLLDDDSGSDTATATALVTGVGLHQGVLQIIGTAGDDHVTVNQQGNGWTKVHASFLPDGEPHRSFQSAEVERILVVLGGGDDHATVAGNIQTSVLLDGGAGNDHLNGGGGANILLGGSGDDQLIDGNGRNLLIDGLGDNPASAADLAALAQIMSDWISAGTSDDQVPPSNTGATTLQLAGHTDQLAGSRGLDWFFATEDLNQMAD